MLILNRTFNRDDVVATLAVAKSINAASVELFAHPVWPVTSTSPGDAPPVAYARAEGTLRAELARNLPIALGQQSTGFNVVR